MTIKDPVFSANTFDENELRLLITALTGARGGVVSVGDYKVTAQGSPGPTLAVAAGQAIIPSTTGGNLGSYEVANDASVNTAAIAATGANPRWDLIILKIAAGVATPTIVQGTAAGSPAEPSLAAHNDYIRLARIQIPASTTNITNAMIVDQRSFVAPYFPCTSTTRPATPFDGQKIYETDTRRSYIWNAATSAWLPEKLLTATAATLPAAPPQGTEAYVTDAGVPSGAVAPQVAGRPNAPGLYVFDARWDPPWNLPWGVMGYASNPSNQGSVTAEVDATGLSVAFTAVANRRIKITLGWLAEASTGAGDILVARIKEGATELARQDVLQSATASTQGGGSTLIALVTPSAGAHTYKATWQRLGSGNLTVAASATSPFYLLVEDIGPNGQPA